MIPYHTLNTVWYGTSYLVVVKITTPSLDIGQVGRARALLLLDGGGMVVGKCHLCCFVIDNNKRINSNNVEACRTVQKSWGTRHPMSFEHIASSCRFAVMVRRMQRSVVLTFSGVRYLH